MWRLFKDRNQMKRNAKEGKQGTELKMKWGEDLNRIIKKEEEKESTYLIEHKIWRSATLKQI